MPERPAAEGFCHEALCYAQPEELVKATVPLVREAVEAGDLVLAMLPRASLSLLRAALATDAANVGYAEIEGLGRNPARIVTAWREFAQRCAAAQCRGRGICEPVWPGRSRAEVEEVLRSEALLNVALRDARGLRILCAYDAAQLSEAVLQTALHSHGPGAAAAGTGFDPFAGTLPATASSSRLLDFSRGELRLVRAAVEREARAAGLCRSRIADLVLAVDEVAANSILHGGGRGSLHGWLDPPWLIFEVRDRGRIADPLVGSRRPPPEQLHGRGLWLANQLCDLVRIRSGQSGTTVRLQVDLSGAAEAAPSAPDSGFSAATVG